MATNGPLILVDDDPEDRELLLLALKELKYSNTVRMFQNGREALFYLMDTRERPLLILSDINMPLMDGLELRRKVNESHLLHRKSIPFIFFTTSALPEQVIRAYDLMVQGYFVKPDRFDELVRLLGNLLNYWLDCLHPNSEVVAG
ncbi:MAG: response regulator [Chitinophagaceae bacterium]|nr:MAG: response regulator [Chitinophagaceae bacterium]